MRNFRYLKSTGQFLIAIVLMGYVCSFIIKDWNAVRESLQQASLPAVFLSLMAFASGNFILAWTWHVMMKILGAKSDTLSSFYTMYASGLGKYIPGKVWGATLRILLSKHAGISEIKSGAGLVLETYLLIATASMVILLGLTQWSETVSIYIKITAVILSSSVILLHPKILLFVIQWMQKILPGKIKIPGVIPRWKDYLILAWLYVSLWVCWGTGYFFALHAIHQLTVDDFVSIVAGNTLAWLIGFLAFFTPAGIGIRELVLISMANQGVLASETAAAAMISRFLMIIGESTGLAAVFFVRRLFIKP